MPRGTMPNKGRDTMTQKEPLMLKYRPKSFKEVIGNTKNIEALQLKIAENKTKTYLLKGPRGCGKTSIARIMAKELGAEDKDLYELNIADVGLKNVARDIMKMARRAPMWGESKVFILDECQEASAGFQESMLKILEEPPPDVYFILCTTNPEKLKETIRSRCMQFSVRTLVKKEMKQLIRRVLRGEGILDEIPEEAIKKIIKVSGGCPREALTKLDKVIDIEDDETLIDSITSDTIEESEVKELCQALLKKASWVKVAKILKALDKDPESTRRAVLGYMGTTLLNSGLPRAAFVIHCFKDNYYNTGKVGLIQSCYEAIVMDVDD